jgi:hypothetical protein
MYPMAASVVRIRGSNPTVESTGSNLTFVIGSHCNDSVYDYAAVLFKNNRAPNGVNPCSVNATTHFMTLMQTADGAAVCGAGPLYPELAPAAYEATLSLRTRADMERARLSAQGLWTARMTADAYGDLIDDYVTTTSTHPVSGTALSTAFSTLSNMFTTYMGSNAVAYPPSSSTITLIDSYRATSITDAPTANALNGAYTTLSNYATARVDGLSRTIPNLVYSATVAALSAVLLTANSNTSNSTYGGSNAVAGLPITFLNDAWLVSLPDGEPRLRAETGGETAFASAGTFTGGGAFRWVVNDVQRTVATLDGDGNLWGRGAASFGANVVAASNLACASLNVGGAHITCSTDGSNLGINLPPGATPQYALHVQGMIYSDEGVYALSDAQEKSDIVPLQNAVSKLRKLRGYSYTCRGRRRLGLLAQEVQRIAPEAVILSPQFDDDNGQRLAVSYADVLALVVEAVHELSELHLKRNTNSRYRSQMRVRAFSARARR